jgi:signal peptidase I
MLYFPGELHLKARKPSINWHKVRDEWVKPILTALIIGGLINLFFPRYYVQGSSMEPNLHEDERLFVSNVDVITGNLIRGEIVVITSPHGEVNAVKRIIGLPGETIRVADRVVYVNGVALAEPYISQPPRYEGEWQIGADEYFVLGDNRNNSTDSADYGPIASSRVHGVVKFSFWPLTEAQVFDVPQY